MNEELIKFGLRKITTSQFATVDTVEINEDAIQLNFGFTFGINEEHRNVGCNVKFEFLSDERLFMVIDILCDFEVAQDSWEGFLDVESNKITLPLSMVTHMTVLTVGTARGVLHCKTENTKYNKYFLPTINVTDSITSDITIDLIKEE